MSYILYALGIFIILYTLLDIIWTTLWVDGGAGWLTDRLTIFSWPFFYFLPVKIIISTKYIKINFIIYTEQKYLLFSELSELIEHLARSSPFSIGLTSSLHI